MENAPWLIGSVMIIGGLLIGMGGTKFYPVVVSTVGALMAWQMLWAFMLLYREPNTVPRRILLDIFMSGTVFGILYKFKKIITYFTGIVGGLFLGMILAISISAIANWNSFYMMAFVMGVSAMISIGASWKAF
jgi:hypothetical protein